MPKNPKMAIYAHLGLLLTVMDTMPLTSNIAMLGIPGLSMKNAAHQ
jgi:hypothetical protein